MNILYLIGALLLLIVLSYSYFIYVVAVKQIGQALSGLFVALVVLIIVLFQTGAAQMPRFMPERATTRMRSGMSGYVTGMMVEDERAIDEFIRTLKAHPEVYSKFREKLK